MKNDFFKKNRIKLLRFIENESISIFFSGDVLQKCADEPYPFTPDRNFYYLTGISEPSCVFVLLKAAGTVYEFLFIKRQDERLIKWVGSSLESEKAQKISGINEILYLDTFYEFFSSLLIKYNINILYLDLQKSSWNDKPKQPSVKFANEIRNKYYAVIIKDISDDLSNLRKVKENCEIEAIKKAINITNEGLKFLFQNMSDGMYEYEIESYFDFILKKSGVTDLAFKSIVASGKNATILHYSKNNCKAVNGELLLLDLGASYDYYSADITRTVPINGKFSPRQKELYNIVLGGQKCVIDAIRPGIPYKSLNEILLDYYFIELKKIGLIENRDDISKYYYHQVSHYLGLQTHDVGDRNYDTLKEGNVITVEPGLYLEEEMIGIRIEDDVYVTCDGCIVLSDNIIKTVDEIEDILF